MERNKHQSEIETDRTDKTYHLKIPKSRENVQYISKYLSCSFLLLSSSLISCGLKLNSEIL